MVRALQIVGVGASGIVAQAMVDPAGTFAGLEKLGVAMVTVAILLWLLKQERDERRGAGARLDQVQEEIRKEHSAVIAGHAEAMRENARAQERLGEVLARALERMP